MQGLAHGPPSHPPLPRNAPAPAKECRFIEGYVMSDHVYMWIEIPPKYGVASCSGPPLHRQGELCLVVHTRPLAARLASSRDRVTHRARARERGKLHDSGDDSVRMQTIVEWGRRCFW